MVAYGTRPVKITAARLYLKKRKKKKFRMLLQYNNNRFSDINHGARGSEGKKEKNKSAACPGRRLGY